MANRIKYSQQYMKEILELNNEALRASYYSGVKRSLGRLSLGNALAIWDAEEGDTAWLNDAGFKVAGQSLPSIFPVFGPNRLRIFGEPEELDQHKPVVEVTDFDMNLGLRNGYINVYRSIFDGSDPIKPLKRYSYRFKEWRHGLGSPSDEDLALLYRELERGASGAYALKDIDG